MKSGISVKTKTRYRTFWLNLTPKASGPVMAPVSRISKKNSQKQTLKRMQPKLDPQMPHSAAKPVLYPVPAVPVVVDAAMRSAKSIVETANKGIFPFATKKPRIVLSLPARLFIKTPATSVAAR